MGAPRIPEICCASRGYGSPPGKRRAYTWRLGAATPETVFSPEETNPTVKLEEYLQTCRELNALCTQNGWIDSDTLQVDVLDQGPASVLAAVTFEEILMEGAGCVAGRVSCYGRVKAHLGPAGDVERLEIL